MLGLKTLSKVAGCIAVGAPILNYVRNEVKPCDNLTFYRDKNTRQIVFASARVPNEWDDYEEWTRPPTSQLTNSAFIQSIKSEYRHPFVRSVLRTIWTHSETTYSLNYYISPTLYLDKTRDFEQVK